MISERVSSNASVYAFPAGGGEMGGRLRERDWSDSPLGAPQSWPAALKTLVSLMLESRQPMFIAWGRAHQVWLYNDAFIPIMGAKHPARLARHALDDVWAEARDMLAPLFERVFSGEAVHMEDFGLQLDRRGRMEEAHFSFSYTPVRDESGVVAGLFGACIEITDSVLAARREQAAIERQRRMFEQAPGFMCVLSGPAHVYEFVNKAHRRIFNSADWVGKPVREAIPGIEGQGYYEQLDEVYRTGTRYIAEAQPIKFVRDAGAPPEERLLTFIFEPMVDDAGQVNGIFCVGNDVTDAHRAQQALRSSEARLRDEDRRKDEFIATLAHELRNPLAPLRSAIFLIKGAPEPTRVQALREMMERQVEQMVRLVDDLLDVSRITQGKLALRVERVDLRQVVSNALETTAPAVKQAGCNARASLPTDAAWVSGDAVRLTQVLSNLINNAAKFSEPGAAIDVKLTVQARHAVASVTDAGIGIAADKLEEIFEMFAQLHTSLDRTKSGLGLGLSLARRIVQLHGGTLEAWSAGPGCGSVFTMRLPLAAPA